MKGDQITGISSSKLNIPLLIYSGATERNDHPHARITWDSTLWKKLASELIKD